jgi:hypothetical protein
MAGFAGIPRTSRPAPADTLTGLFATQIRRTPGAVASSGPDGELSYAALAGMAPVQLMGFSQLNGREHSAHAQVYRRAKSAAADAQPAADRAGSSDALRS